MVGAFKSGVKLAHPKTDIVQPDLNKFIRRIQT